MDLLIGAGSNHIKKVIIDKNSNWNNLITLDFNKDHHPDYIHDLENLPLPFDDNYFDEIHAYEVLEHTGKQGDFKFFFNQFSDFWRILKPSGYLCGTCPLFNKIWAFGDPGHSRVIQKESFHYLNQKHYIEEIGKTTMSDYRFIYKADFDLVYYKEEQYCFTFALQAIKPSRINEKR